MRQPENIEQLLEVLATELQIALPWLNVTKNSCFGDGIIISRSAFGGLGTMPVARILWNDGLNIQCLACTHLAVDDHKIDLAVPNCVAIIIAMIIDWSPRDAIDALDKAFAERGFMKLHGFGFGQS